MVSAEQEWMPSSIKDIASQEQEIPAEMDSDETSWAVPVGDEDTQASYPAALSHKRYRAILLNPGRTGPVIQHGIMADFLGDKERLCQNSLYSFRLSILCRELMAWFGLGAHDRWIVYVYKGDSLPPIRLLPNAYHFWEVLYDYIVPPASQPSSIDSDFMFLVEVARDPPSPRIAPESNSSRNVPGGQAAARDPHRSIGIQVDLVTETAINKTPPPTSTPSNPKPRSTPSRRPATTVALPGTTNSSPSKRLVKSSQPSSPKPRLPTQSRLPAPKSVRPSLAIHSQSTKIKSVLNNKPSPKLTGKAGAENSVAADDHSISTTTPKKSSGATPTLPKEMRLDKGPVDVSNDKEQNDVVKNEPQPYAFCQDPRWNSVLGRLHAQTSPEDDDFLIEGGDPQKAILTAAGPDDEQWAKCCRLLLINPEEHKDPRKRSVSIPHTSIKLTPRQYWTAYEMLSSHVRSSMCGGILADGPGTGKTWVVLGYLALRVLVLTNIAEVESDWAKKKTSRHSPKPDRYSPWVPPPPCKCKNSMGIECYANLSSVTNDIHQGMQLVRGPAVMLVSSGVIEEWKQALLDCKLSTTYFHPILFHTNVPPSLKPPADLKSQLKTTAEVWDIEKVYSPNHEPRHDELEFEFKPPSDRNGKQPERFLFLTTHDAKLFEAEFQIPVMLPIEPVNTEGKPRGAVKKYIYGCPVGVEIVDEFHKVRHRQSPPVRLAHAHRKMMGDWDTDFWSVTGTPMPNDFMDLYTTLEILESGWGGSRSCFHGTKALLALIAAQKVATAPGASRREKSDFEEIQEHFFNCGLILRNDEDTEFFGQRITDIKPVKPKLLVYNTPQIFMHDVQKVAHDIKAELTEIQPDPIEAYRSKLGFEKLEVLQVLSTFPGAAKLVLDGAINLTKPALRKAIATLGERQDVSRVALFRDCFSTVVQDSPKLSAILEYIHLMMEDQEERPEQVISEIDAKKEWFKPNDTKLKKMVIITPSYGEAIFIYMAVKKFVAKCRPVLFHYDLKASEKTEVLKDWNILTKQTKHRVFIAPFDLGGTGLNLQTANYQILTGPLRFKSDEVQCFRRTNREGQQLSLFRKHLILATEDNPHDRLVVARQAMRSITSDPFSLSTELELSRSRTY